MATVFGTTLAACTWHVMEGNYMRFRTKDGQFSVIRWSLSLVAFRVSRRRREMYSGHPRLCVCLSVYPRPAACLHYCTDPGVTWGSGRGCPPSCALLGGFAIGTWVALLWQHNANSKS